jgi:hypothetical protein
MLTETSLIQLLSYSDATSVGETLTPLFSGCPYTEQGYERVNTEFKILSIESKDVHSHDSGHVVLSVTSEARAPLLTRCPARLASGRET